MALIFIFPVLLILFTFFFGYISFSILIKKKPVILSSKWLLLISGLGLLPILLINLSAFFLSGNGSILNLIASAMLIFLLVFYFFIIKGVSIYGITDDDFRKFLFQTLSNMEIKYTEKLNRINLDDYNASISVSFQEWMGTGMMKMKGRNMFDFKAFVLELKKSINQNAVKTKKMIAYFYMIFSVLLFILSIFFLFIIFFM